jgi:hypothetical protein
MNGTILQSPAALTHQGRQLLHYCFKLSNHASIHTAESHDQTNWHVGCCSPVAQPETLLHVCQQQSSNNDDISYSTRRQQGLAAAHQSENWKRRCNFRARLHVTLPGSRMESAAPQASAVANSLLPLNHSPRCFLAGRSLSHPPHSAPCSRYTAFTKMS